MLLRHLDSNASTYITMSIQFMRCFILLYVSMGGFRGGPRGPQPLSSDFLKNISNQLSLIQVVLLNQLKYASHCGYEAMLSSSQKFPPPPPPFLNFLDLNLVREKADTVELAKDSDAVLSLHMDQISTFL